MRVPQKVKKMLVDQGFEHRRARGFAPNPAAYDPHCHYARRLGGAAIGFKA